MATIEELARQMSNLTDLTVVLIRSSNGGSTSRYQAFQPFGEDALHALAEDDAAYLTVSSHNDLLPMIEQVAANLCDEGGLVQCDVTSFEKGEQVYSVNLDGSDEFAAN